MRMGRVRFLFVAMTLLVACSLSSEGPGDRPERPEVDPTELGGPSKLGKADGFDWGSGCKGGSGTFTQDISKNTVVTVGTIPVGKANIEIKLTSAKDVDIQLFAEDGTKIVQWPDGQLNAEGEGSVTYKGVKVKYSGYNGDGTNLGHEYIKLTGTTTTTFTMKAFGYAAGSAKVDYTFEAPADCTDSGSGTFTQTITKDAVVKVGDIPVGLENIKIALKSSVDIDIQLYKGSTKVVHWSDGLIKGATKVSKTYDGVKITWSGYNGDGTGKGNEYIEIVGKTQSKLVMKVFGYEAGSAAVTYSWGKSSGGGGTGGSGDLSFFVFGDTRGSTVVVRTIAQSMVTLDPNADALFNTGDITDHGKATQTAHHLDMIKQGSNNKIRPDLTSWSNTAIRYFGVVGNHDTGNSDWLNVWNQYFSGQKDLGQQGTYFKLLKDGVLFIVLDSDNTSAAQTAWLKGVLQSSEAQQATWKLAFFHHPVYPCNPKKPFAKGIEWVRLFEQYKVDVAFVAHSHTYERTCAMVKGKCKAGGVVYINSSAGGAPRRDIQADRTAVVGTDSYHCADDGGDPGILAKGIGKWHHYCHVAISGKTLKHRCFSHDATTGPKDSVTISKP
jgi:Calcineurin-like phosphoesterase